MLGILFAVLASISFAFAYTVLKRSYSNFPPSVAFFIDVVWGLLFFIPFGIVTGAEFSHFGLVFIYQIVNAILAEAFFFYVLSKGEISITGTILASYPIATVILSLLINNEHFSLITGGFIVITIIGILIVSLPQSLQKQEKGRYKYILWALTGSLAIGLADTLNKHIISQTSAGTVLFALALAQIPVGLIYLSLEKQSITQFSKIITHIKEYQFSIIGSALNVIGIVFLFLAFQNTLASIAAPISASYPGLMVILAIIFLKDTLSKKDLIGLLCIILGVICLSIWS